MRRAIIWLGCVIALIFAPACERQNEWQKGEFLSFRPVPFSQLPLWIENSEASLQKAMESFRYACGGMKGRDYRLTMPVPLSSPPPHVWRTLCEAAQSLEDEWQDGTSVRFFFENFFQPYEVAAEGASSLLTGYYEPELTGSRLQTKEFTVPLYGRPHDLLRLRGEDFGMKNLSLWGKSVDGNVVPYDTRGEVMRHGLEGRAPILAWVEDESDAFFFSIQGSGRIRLQDGTLLRLGYEARNGYPYRSIGRAMAELGLLKEHELSHHHIREFLQHHPSEILSILSINPSYIFFRIVDESDENVGPIGSFGVPLVGEHALAVDDSIMPLGMPLWLVTTQPLDIRPWARLMMTLDTGSAIKGALRGDIFWGAGEQAMRAASNTKQKGQFFILVPITIEVENLP